MALPQSSMNLRARPESADPFAMQLALSRVHARLVPMERDEHGYVLDPSAQGWLSLPAERGFAGYGLGRALRMLLDVLRGLTALHDTFDAQGVDFAHGEVAITQLRVDGEGVCRLVPLSARHSVPNSRPAAEALGYLAPERLLGEAVDARADVFSAGVLLWEALAGRRLFNETVADTIVDRLMGEKLQMPQLPPELAWAIPLKSIAARALSVDPYQRFADCAELATSISIVARDRVAAHSEITAFFGPQLRSSGSVAQPRPVPSRSSTFPSVSLPVAPASVTAPPTSRNGFPLATPAPRAVMPVPRSITSAPRAVTPAHSVTPIPRSIAPAPRSLTPAPTSVRSADAQPNGPYKSHFATLIGTGEVVPASHKRKTLTSLGTPHSALAPLEAAPASTPRASTLPPPPAWPAGVSEPSRPSLPPASTSAVVARATLNSIALGEVAQFRSWSPRRWGIALAIVVGLGIVVGLIASASGDSAPEAKQKPAPGLAPIPAPAALPVPEPMATAEDHARTEPAPRAATEPGSSSSVSAPKELRTVPKAAAPAKPASATKDYGI